MKKSRCVWSVWNIHTYREGREGHICHGLHSLYPASLLKQSYFWTHCPGLKKGVSHLKSCFLKCQNPRLTSNLIVLQSSWSPFIIYPFSSLFDPKLQMPHFTTALVPCSTSVWAPPRGTCAAPHCPGPAQPLAGDLGCNSNSWSQPNQGWREAAGILRRTHEMEAFSWVLMTRVTSAPFLFTNSNCWSPSSSRMLQHCIASLCVLILCSKALLLLTTPCFASGKMTHICCSSRAVCHPALLHQYNCCHNRDFQVW